jgi:tol-pal system protein YbgF
MKAGCHVKSIAPLLVVALFAAGCATEPAIDPVQVRLDDLDSRVGRIDRIVSNQSLVQMANRIDAQQEEIRQLHGQIEELQNDNTRLRQEQRNLYADLDKRLGEAAATAAAANAAANAVAAASMAPTLVGDEQTQYDRALEQLRTRDYGAAAESFRSLAAAFPNGQLADNTQYWLGETYYVTQEYDHAVAAFQRVLTEWPNSRKAPDALLKLGYTQLEQGKQETGRATLQQVVTKYPGTDAAKLAGERLAKLPK